MADRVRDPALRRSGWAAAGRAPVPWPVAARATLHCLTGCAIGEVLGMVIGTSAGLHNATTVIVSIAVMELLDNVVMIAVPGAMNEGPASALFWGSLAGSLAVAFAFTTPLNRVLIGRGEGHAVLHPYHQAAAEPARPSPRPRPASTGTLRGHVGKGDNDAASSHACHTAAGDRSPL